MRPNKQAKRAEKELQRSIDAAVVVRRRRPKPPRPLLALCRRDLSSCPAAAATSDLESFLGIVPLRLRLPAVPLPARASAPGVLPSDHRPHFLPAVSAAAAGAALRQEGQESARAAHAHQVQSQEIQAQGPLVHEVSIPDHERRADSKVEGRQAPQCTPQVQGSKAKTSETCIGAFSLRKSYKEAQLLWLGNEGNQDGVWQGKILTDIDYLHPHAVSRCCSLL